MSPEVVPPHDSSETAPLTSRRLAEIAAASLAHPGVILSGLTARGAAAARDGRRLLGDLVGRRALIAFDAERRCVQIEATAFRHGRAVAVSPGVGCLPGSVGPIPDGIVITAGRALAEAKRAGNSQDAEQEGAVAAGMGCRGRWNL